MQMLIYLFALRESGKNLFGSETIPSGVLYIPARDVTVKASRNTTEEELEKQRERELRRGGLVLDDPDVIEAMENSGDKKYLPVKTSKDGAMSGESLVSTGQVEILSNHVNKMLRRASDDILSGGIECSPYYKSDNDNACLYCEYHAVCGFDESAGGRRRYVPAMKANEVWEAMRSGAKELF
jgi:ATP-dependent helicase/nuclease subunit B